MADYSDAYQNYSTMTTATLPKIDTCEHQPVIDMMEIHVFEVEYSKHKNYVRIKDKSPVKIIEGTADYMTNRTTIRCFKCNKILYTVFDSNVAWED